MPEWIFIYDAAMGTLLGPKPKRGRTAKKMAKNCLVEPAEAEVQQLIIFC